jgi:hypothetical protein
MLCKFASAGNHYACESCGRKSSKPVKVRCRTQPGLGDIVKSALSAIGVTEGRVSKLLGKPCGCGKRAEAMNEWGRKLGIGGKPENPG